MLPVICRCLSFVVGGGDEVRILLGAPLKCQKIIVAASAAREAPAQRRARLIDGATAFFRVKEAAHAAEDMVFLAAHGILCTPPLHRKLRLGLPKGEAKMFGQPFYVPLVESDERIGAAVAWTLLAVVHRRAQGPNEWLRPVRLARIGSRMHALSRQMGDRLGDW